MASIRRITFIILGVLVLGGLHAFAAQAPSSKHEVRLSEELTELLRAEMRALLGATQTLPAGIATADWKSVAEIGAQISASYILDQKLTAKQKKELRTSLPEHFKRLDADFHLEAKKLEAAAKRHDPQLTSFHYYRLLETCTACHAIYALKKFPGFSRPAGHAHGH